MKRLKMPDEYRPLEKLARQQGWEISHTRNNHLAWRPPGGHVVYTPCTPSVNGTGLIRIKSKLRRAGLRIER